MNDGILIRPVLSREHRAASAAPGRHHVAQPPRGVRLHGGLDQQHVAGVFISGGQRREAFRLQRVAALLQGGQLLLQPQYRAAGGVGLHRQLPADGAVLLPAGGQIVQRPLAAQQLQPHAAAELLPADELHQPHLGAGGHMGAAAGAAVRAGELGDPHRAIQRLLAAVAELGQRVAVRPQDLHGVVFPDVLIGPPLYLQHALPGDLGVVVDGHHVGAHVEAHVVAVVGAAQHTGDDVLAGVLLHMVKAALPVDFAVYGNAHRQGMGAGVADDAIALLHVQHRLAAQPAQVAGLAAALRIKGGAVERDEVALPLRDAVRHHSVEGAHVRVVIVQFDGIHALLPCGKFSIP